LDLEQFSASVETLCERDYRNLFYFTAGELENPHRDIRGSYDDHAKTRLEGERLFFMLTGESPQTFYKGLFTPVRIVKNIEREDGSCTVKNAKLDNNVDGFINLKNSEEIFFNTMLHEGCVVNAKIDNIEYDKFSVSLTCMKENMEDEEIMERIDPQYRPFFVVKKLKDFKSEGDDD
jgi:transcriptional accessory protein Tex/SPT6